MTISDEAVEASARVMLDKMYDDKTLKVDDEDRDIMRAALEAVAPFIRAEALEDAAVDLVKDRPILVATWLRARAAEMRQG